MLVRLFRATSHSKSWTRGRWRCSCAAFWRDRATARASAGSLSTSTRGRGSTAVWQHHSRPAFTHRLQQTVIVQFNCFFLTLFLTSSDSANLVNSKQCISFINSVIWRFFPLVCFCSSVNDSSCVSQHHVKADSNVHRSHDILQTGSAVFHFLSCEATVLRL